MSNSGIESIEIDVNSETVVNLATCSYYFMIDHLDPFTLGPEALCDELISSEMSFMDLHEFSGKLLFEHLDNAWALQSAHGDVTVTREILIKEATAILRNLASDGTQDLMNQVLQNEYASDREIHRVFGSIVVNEVIVQVLMSEIRRSGLDKE